MTKQFFCSMSALLINVIRLESLNAWSTPLYIRLYTLRLVMPNRTEVSWRERNSLLPTSSIGFLLLPRWFVFVVSVVCRPVHYSACYRNESWPSVRKTPYHRIRMSLGLWTYMLTFLLNFLLIICGLQWTMTTDFIVHHREPSCTIVHHRAPSWNSSTISLTSATIIMAVVGVSGTRAVQKIEQKRFLSTLLKK